MQIIVQLTPQAAQSARDGSFNTPSLAELAQIMSENRVQMLPMYPGLPDLELMTYFVVDTPGQAEAEAVVNALRHHPDVQAAYIQPPTEPA